MRIALNLAFLLLTPASVYWISESGYGQGISTPFAGAFVLSSWVVLLTRRRLSRFLVLLASGIPVYPLFFLMLPGGIEAAGVFVGSYINILAVWLTAHAMNRSQAKAEN